MSNSIGVSSFVWVFLLLLLGFLWDLKHLYLGQLFFPPPDTFKDLHSLILCGPELHTVFKMRLHQCWIQQDNYLFWRAGYAAFDAPQHAVCPFGCQGKQLTHIKPAANQDPQTPFCRAFLQLLFFHFILVPSLTPSEVQIQHFTC